MSGVFYALTPQPPPYLVLPRAVPVLNSSPTHALLMRFSLTLLVPQLL